MSASPIIKWVGGKTKLLPELLARMPEAFGRYYEPFMGGAALFFRVAPARAVLNDLNRDLVNLYRTVTIDVDTVIRHLEMHKRLHSERHYYDARAWWNDREDHPDSAMRAAAFVYLNKTCFNGLWRVNKSSQFNVPMGKYKNPPICVPDALRAAQVALSRATLRSQDYRAAVDDSEPGDFLYFDPPYDPFTETSNFTSYTADAFGQDQQRELADLARRLVEHGRMVMLSNNDTPLVRSIYEGFSIDTVKCARSINSDASKRGAVNEVIITGGYQVKRSLL